MMLQASLGATGSEKTITCPNPRCSEWWRGGRCPAARARTLQLLQSRHSAFRPAACHCLSLPPHTPTPLLRAGMLIVSGDNTVAGEAPCPYCRVTFCVACSQPWKPKHEGKTCEQVRGACTVTTTTRVTTTHMTTTHPHARACPLHHHSPPAAVVSLPVSVRAGTRGRRGRGRLNRAGAERHRWLLQALPRLQRRHLKV